MINTELFKLHNVLMIAGIAIAANMLLLPLYAKIAGKD